MAKVNEIKKATTRKHENTIPMSTIVVNPKYQLRSSDGTKQRLKEIAQEYAESNLDKFPPVTVAQSEDEELNNLLLDGFTRYLAHELDGRKEIPVKFVSVPNRKKAMEIAARSNSIHGLRPVKEDLKLAMKSLKSEGFERKEIAEILKVSPAKVTRLLGPQKSSEEKAARRAILDDSSLSNKDAAKKLGTSTSAVSHARNKRPPEPQESSSTSSEPDYGTGDDEEFQDENVQLETEGPSGITLEKLHTQATMFKKFLGEFLKEKIVPEAAWVKNEVFAAKKSVERLINACAG